HTIHSYTNDLCLALGDEGVQVACELNEVVAVAVEARGGLDCLLDCVGTCRAIGGLDLLLLHGGDALVCCLEGGLLFYFGQRHVCPPVIIPRPHSAAGR